MTTINLTSDGHGGTGEPARSRDHAEAAAEAVRALNHATLRHGDPAGYQWPADVDAVVAELGLLASRLPQVFDQAGSWLTAQADAGRVRHDDQVTDIGHAVGWVLQCLDDATANARELASVLACARQASAHLAGIDPADPEGGGL